MNRDIEHNKLNVIINHIVSLKAELNKLRDQNLMHHLNPPALIEDVSAVEQFADFPLPNDYREFLLIHDGWTGMNGQNDLLSTNQMLSGPMKSSIQNLKKIQTEMTDPSASGFVIEASLSDTDIAYLDPATRRPNGDMDVVRWDGQAGEYKRYEDFTGYLTGYAKSLERRIASEQRRLR